MISGNASTPLSWIPFRITPHYDLRPWGFQDLRPWYNRTAETEPIGEVWLTGDMCLAETGPLAGQKLGDIFASSAQQMLGPNAQEAASPLLLKVIFAKDKLSVQVHPDDTLAQKYGDPRGKTECWYALAAEPGAQVACGLKPGTTVEEVKTGIEKGTLEASLNHLDVHAGDMIFMDAGTVHAIWPGAILMETQQNCDLTYRMYDYGRPRPLHIEKSLEAMRLVTSAGTVPPKKIADRTTLIDAEYFRVERIDIKASRTSASLLSAAEQSAGLSYLFAAEGSGRITGNGFDPIELPTRGIIAVPATSPDFTIEDCGALDLIRITPNWPKK